MVLYQKSMRFLTIRSLSYSQKINMPGKTMLKQDISQQEVSNLVSFFGENGAAVVLAHMSDLDETFDTASTVIRRIMHGN